MMKMIAWLFLWLQNASYAACNLRMCVTVYAHLANVWTLQHAAISGAIDFVDECSRFGPAKIVLRHGDSHIES